MPLTRCSEDGKPGWKFGETGACYTFTEGDDASEKAARRKAVRQALAIGGGKPPADLSDVELADDEADVLVECSDAELAAVRMLAAGDNVDPPPGVVRCTMNGTSGFRGDGGPTSACHVHDGSPAGIRSAIAKAVRDRGTANPPPRAAADRELAAAMLETIDLPGVEILSTGGPIHGTGSPSEGDYFSEDDLRAIAAANLELAAEVRVPIKIGHSRGQRLLRNSGLYADEMPAGGWIENWRVSGGKLIADYKRVPRKLAELIKTGAFRTRSVELSRITSQTRGGKVYPAVATAVALLGAKAPAVRTLDDVLAWYAEDDDRGSVEAPVDGLSVEPRIALIATLTEAGPSADTSRMTTPSTTAAPNETALTDEQIVTFAQAFGIEEEDAEKRRAAVLAKFAEHAPDQEPTTPPTPPPDPTPPDPTTPPATAPEPVSALSEDDVRGIADRRYAERALADRVSASIELAIRQCRIEPAKREAFAAFGERDPQGCLDALVAIPVNERLLSISGSDGTGDDDRTAADAMYASYAAQTGVTAHSASGGNS